MLTMRITGGKFCGRRIIIPEGELEIRPAMDRMRESLFSILGTMEGDSFCDLFSGSGCIGLEAASRGAKIIHLVELDEKKRDVIEKNISFAKTCCQIRIFYADVLKFLANNEFKYNTVYADPPFPLSNKTQILELVDKQKTVLPNGLFVIHIPANESDQWVENFGSFVLKDTRTYGRNMIKIYKNVM